MPELRIGVSYDFLNPPNSGVTDQMLYAEILEQVKWLDQIGADFVWFTEHHFVDDGYLPSWTSIAGAMAAVTSRVRFWTTYPMAASSLDWVWVTPVGGEFVVTAK